MSVKTPNDIEFSIAAKTYLCSGRLLPQVGMTFGYPSPQGTLVDHRVLAKDIVLHTVDDLERRGYIQTWTYEKKQLMGKRTYVAVRALHSGGEGFSARFLEATQWVDSDIPAMMLRLLNTTQAPLMEFLDYVSEEFVPAGILARGGYAAHKNAWDPEWLGYLQEAWYPEVYEVYQSSHARPDAVEIQKNTMFACAISQHSDDDFD